MAYAGLEDELKCCICLNIYTDPVSLSCGHNFCKLCIQDLLFNQQPSGEYKCPQCRTVFPHRPDCKVNTTLSNIVQHCLNLRDVERAMGTCSLHRKLLEYYCFKDNARICASCCAAPQHRGHEMMGLNEATDKKKQDLRGLLEQLALSDEEEIATQSRREHLQKVMEKAATVKESIIVLFEELEYNLADLKKNVLAEISRQEQPVYHSVSSFNHESQVFKDGLYGKMLLIEELINTPDNVTVLQTDVSDLTITGGEPNAEHAGDLEEDFISQLLKTGLLEMVNNVTKGTFVPEAVNLTLNVHTAGRNVNISSDSKTASWSGFEQNRSNNPERFQYNQVLSVRSFSSGRCYIDLKTSETGNWTVGLAYASMDRNGHQSLIGDNDKSWGLRRYENQYSVTHGGEATDIGHKPSSNQYRIYLDYEVGQMSFYELGERVRHLHTFTATFTEPLHIALWVWCAWVRIKS
ncbi:zinc finger protein RFP-like [Hyperolius riggenbachi]|uniref:zinc finger protein RFP-like n=1 Tax=Hyperolius riggenbachi TaxID=752182 RepID=UPI0035A2CEEB